jgi:Tfp pilus assembly protein PilO
MDQLKRFLWPVVTGGAVLVVALIAVSAYIIPEGHKVSAANASKVTLEAQQASLQSEILGLEHESRSEPKNCSTLRQDLTLVPTTPTVDLFLHQISQLATDSGTATPSVTIASAGASAGTGSVASGAETVGIDLEVSGTYRQVLNFLDGLGNVHSLQRLYAVSSVTLDGNTTGASTGGVYSLQLQGNIYYSTAEQDVCSTTKNGNGSQST